MPLTRRALLQAGVGGALACTASVGCAGTIGPMASAQRQALDDELSAVVHDARHPLASLCVLALRSGEVVYEGQWGQRHMDAQQPSASRPATADTLYRVASLSKLITTLGVLRLVEQGALALDADIGQTLGHPLRNPHFPSVPVTLRHLLSHTSSLRDEAGYYWDSASGVQLRDVLQPGGAQHGDGRMWSRRAPPGAYFEYANLPWGVVGGAMEAATGERFDRLMQRLVLEPLGLRGGFEPAEMSPSDLAQLATLYRKRQVVDGREVWRPDGSWVPQVDDYSHRKPVPRAAHDYVPGRNGTLFGPQGNARLSARGCGVVLRMLMNGGVHEGQRFLQASTVRTMLSAQWRSNGLSGAQSNGADLDGMMQAWGLGAQQYLGRGTGQRSDRLVPGSGFAGWGHFGDAWGLRALMVFQPDTRNGMVFLSGGCGFDPDTTPGEYSHMYRFEERILSGLHRHALGGAAG